MNEDTCGSGSRRTNNRGGAAAGGGAYGLAFIGALIYFIQNATGFVDGLYGVLKAILWPAFLIYRMLDFLNM